MDRPLRTLVALAALSVALPAGLAEHCTTYSTSSPEVDAGTFYADVDWCFPEGFCSVWVYEESNGIPGLQRADELSDDTCHGMIAGDTLAF